MTLLPKPPSSFGGNLLLYAGCCAVAAWMFWPTIRDALPPVFSLPAGNHTGVTPWRPGMKLDPTRVDTIDDRRGRGGTGRDLGGDIRRGGIPPWELEQHGRGGPPPWTDGRAEAPDDDGSGPEMSRSGRGRPMCWDRLERRPVDLSFCRGGR